MKIERTTIISDILNHDKDLAPVFLSVGMHCLGCPVARSETVEQACMAHGVDCDDLLEKLNAKSA